MAKTLRIHYTINGKVIDTLLFADGQVVLATEYDKLYN